MNLPPVRRSHYSASLAEAPVDGELHLQRCADCTAVQYPPRERCGHCLADALRWERVPGEATVLAVSMLSHSMEPWFAERVPWPIASLRLEAGPVVFAHLAAQNAVAGNLLRVANARDASGVWCLVAFDPATSAFTTQLSQLGMSA